MMATATGIDAVAPPANHRVSSDETEPPLPPDSDHPPKRLAAGYSCEGQPLVQPDL
jgi:hypothetical protein